jgi:hypothetical protein
MSTDTDTTQPAESDFTGGDGDAPVLRPLGTLVRWMPLLAFQLYLNASLALHAFGPWIWPATGLRRMYVFVLLAHVALLAGYATAVRRQPRQYVGRLQPRSLLWLSSIGTLALFLPTLLMLTGGTLDIAGALAEPSVAYYRYQELVQAGGGGGAITYLRLLAAPLFPLLMPLLVFCWRDISGTQRIIGVVAVLSDLMLYLATGRNKGLMDLLLLLPWLIAIHMLAHGVRLRLGRTVLAIVAGGALLAFVTNFYARNTTGRVGSAGALLLMPLLSGVEADPDNVMIRNQPPLVQVGVLGLTFSQTHGYGALALALDKEWVPTWGLGHSYFLQTVAARVSGSDWVRANSYPGRLEQQDGWPLTEYWHSIYPWLASDLSWTGTLVFVFLLGRLLALSWLDSLRGHNPWAMGLFILLATMLYYFPTNNIVLGFPESLIGFWLLTVLWLRTRGDEVQAEGEEPEWDEAWSAGTPVPLQTT